MDIALVIKIDIFSMPRFHEHKGNSSLAGKKMLLDVPEGGFIRDSKEHVFKRC